MPLPALPERARRVTLPFERSPSFLVSLTHLEDATPTGSWSADGAAVFAALLGVGERQRDPIGAFATRRDHYQRQPEKLVSEAVAWIEARPALADFLPYLWSFRISPRHRVWGLLIDGVFHLLWNDPEHAIFLVAEGTEIGDRESESVGRVANSDPRSPT
ncbi:hypothetical protein EON77_12880 [bacterium]|nr:MAG: hypothetical protein EON77_12880 [bacterium]